jgi:hypothetical protein
MAKKLAVLLAVFMLAVIIWGLFFEGNTTRIIVNGQELSGPFQGAIGLAGLVVAWVAFFCAAILLLFVFAGIGIFVLGGMVALGLVVAGLMFPNLLIMLVPLAIIWGFIALTRRRS